MTQPNQTPAPRGLDDASGEEWNAVSRSARAMPQPGDSVERPIQRPGLAFIAECPQGAQMLAVNGRVVLVAPGHPPYYVEPTGLRPIDLIEVQHA